MALPTVIFDGVDLCDRFHLIWTNDSVLNPPEVRMNRLELPAMDGKLDLSEALAGDVLFGDRVQEMVFYVQQGHDFELIKTQMLDVMNGRSVDYELSVDPGYTYHGRWECESHFSRLNYREIKFKVTADPWKRGQHMRYQVHGAGGTIQTLVNGRRHVSPSFKVSQPTLVEYKDRAWEIPEAGTWTLDLRLDEGVSVIHVNSAPTQGDATWQDLADRYGTWSAIPKGTRWSDVFWAKKDPPTDAQYDVVIEYDCYFL